jgi:phage major head subunit gpT-like protein
MTGNWMDRAISYFAPSFGANRVKSRIYQDQLESSYRMYEGAAQSKRTEGCVALTTSANSEVKTGLVSVRSRARDLVRNNPYANRIVSVITTNTVGSGITGQIKAHGDDTHTHSLNDPWRKWAETTNCDFEGKMDFYGIQSLVMRSVVESGECLVRIRRRRKSRGSALFQLQVLESDFLDTNKEGMLPSGGYIIQGIEFDSKDQIEVSLVSVPADMRSGLRSIEGIKINEEKDMKVNPSPSPVLDESPPPVEKAEVRAIDPTQIIRAERDRVRAITQAVRAAKLPQELLDELVTSELTTDQARERIIEEFSKASTPSPTRSHIRLGDLEETDTRRAAMMDSILNRVDSSKYKIAGASREYAGSSLLDLGKECLGESGVKTRGLYPMDIAERALSTSDFQNILMGVANKTLRDAYQSAPQTFRLFCREVEARDFKPLNCVQLGSDFKLEEVIEDGEIKRGKLVDGKESYAIKTYAKIVPITRKVIINDDLNSLARLPAMAGVAASNLESNLVWGLITKPQIMESGKPLFDKAHRNMADVGSAIGISSVSEGRVAIKQQRDLGDEFITLIPKFLVVPTTLETKAQQFTSENMKANKIDEINPFSSAFTVVAEPRLDFSSTPNAWYLFTSKDQIEMIEIAYLSGNQGVFIETKLGFEIDGLQMKIREDFGAHCIDYRGFYKNPGVK